MKKIEKGFIFICLFLMIFPLFNVTYALSLNDKLDESILGIGGGGAIFEPKISPFDSNTMTVISDMGNIYITHDAGVNWDRHNLHGKVNVSYFDTNREGVIYAGGSGLYRSTDNGKTFDIIFPKKEDIIDTKNMNENGIHYIFTYSKLYPYNRAVKSVVVNPNDSDNIFVLCYYGKVGIVFESKDNGETFNTIFEYQKEQSANILYDLNKLFYKKETNELYLVNSEDVYKYDVDNKILSNVYSSSNGIVEASSFYEDGTNFVFIEKTNELEYSQTKLLTTKDFITFDDLTEKLLDNIYIKEGQELDGRIPEFDDTKTGHNKYKWSFNFVDATSLNNIYVTQSSRVTEGKYQYIVCALLKFDGENTKYIYGLPYKNHNNLTTKGWSDGNISAYGFAADPKNPDAFIYTTLCGVIYSDDSIHLHSRSSTKIDNTHFTTSGIDVQTTYGVRFDPFNKNVMMLLNTDLGLIRSTDNGATWERTNKGIKDIWVNTVYDLIYDEYQEGVVYSIWSGRHDAPYSPGNETNRNGGFAYSNDGGVNWDTSYSTGLPANVVPLKMAIEYKDDKRIIYVATFNEGFFISEDAGKTFKPMNNGIKRVKYNETTSYILAADIEVVDGHIFGLTAKNGYADTTTQNGEVLEYINGEWKKISLPEKFTTPRDVYYHDGTLYISGNANSIWEYKNGCNFNNYYGGVYAYKDGEVTQIFDETISTTGVQIDSRGTIYISDINGNIYRKEKDKEYEKIYDSFHSISKGIQLIDDKTIYLATLGGGVLKLENIDKLYEVLKGDLNNNGKIDLTDVLIMLKNFFSTNKNESIFDRADMNDDNALDLTDVLLLLKIYFSLNR